LLLELYIVVVIIIIAVIIIVIIVICNYNYKYQTFFSQCSLSLLLMVREILSVVVLKAVAKFRNSMRKV